MDKSGGNSLLYRLIGGASIGTLKESEPKLSSGQSSGISDVDQLLETVLSEVEGLTQLNLNARLSELGVTMRKLKSFANYMGYGINPDALTLAQVLKFTKRLDGKYSFEGVDRSESDKILLADFARELCEMNILVSTPIPGIFELHTRVSID